MKKRLAIISTHPIQYYAPLFKQLNMRGVVEIEVFYTLGQVALEDKFDHGFGKIINWDIPLLDGYSYQFLKNTSDKPDSEHFTGIINPDIISKIEQYNPDAILIFGWAFRSHLKAMRYFKKKVPVLFRGDSTILNKQGLIKRTARKLFLQWIYKHIDKALFVGRNNFNYYTSFGLKQEQLIWAPHAIDNKRFQENEIEHAKKAKEIRKQLLIGENDFVFLFAGKLEFQKDPFVLLNAFIHADFSNKAHLVFIGNGPFEAPLKLKAKNSRNIHFMEFQNQQAMPGVYRVADVFVLPSQSETWGLGVNEAMACKKPVIVSDKCGCAPDLVEDGRNGYIFRSHDEADLQQKLLKINDEKERINLMGEVSFQKIQAYTIEKVCRAIENTVLNAI